MSLPVCDLPIFEIEIPSLMRKVKFRPMVVKEERVLLVAKESSDDSAPLLAVKQVINNCILPNDGSVDVDKLPIFDIEWAFVQLWAASNENVIKIDYVDNDDSKDYQVVVDLLKIKPPIVTGVDRAVLLPNGESILLKFPSGELYGSKFDDASVLFKCVEGFVGKDGTVRANDANEADFNAWFEMLPVTTSKAIASFFDELPHMEYSTGYVNSNGKERKMTYTTLSDFFDWR